MQFQQDDPRLIDFALGELEAAEAKAIEAALEEDDNAAARRFVEEIRNLSDASTRALRSEDASMLSEEQRAEVIRSAKERIPTPRRWRTLVPALAAAALLLCVLGTFVLVQGSLTTYDLTEGFELASNAVSEVDRQALERDLAAKIGEVRAVNTSRRGERWVESHSVDAQDLDFSSLTVAELEAELQRIERDVEYKDEEYMSYNEAAVAREPDAANEGHSPHDAEVIRPARPRDDASLRPPVPRPALPTPRLPPAPSTRSNLRAPEGQSTVSPESSLALRLSAQEGIEPATEDDDGDELAIGSRSGVQISDEPIAFDFDPGYDWHVTKLIEETLSRDNVRDGESNTDRDASFDGDFDVIMSIVENEFLRVAREPLSTFSIDVDTASYALVRRFLRQGSLPPPDVVRLEELINYFDYDYPEPEPGRPFGVNVELGPCPWASSHRLAKIGLEGKEVLREDRPSGNFVFLLDVSGSMTAANKLPLVKEAMKALLRELEARDRVGIVTYASNASVHLTSTSCEEKDAIRRSIDRLQAGGSTHGSAGIQDAYAMASEHFIGGGINRVILCTDGDFNVGITDRNALTRLIAEKARSKVFLSVLGFGMGNIKDATLEQLADKGNGNYAYIDDFAEARRTLVDQLTGTLITIAKDVKIQVEFNPAHVGAYRLLGYENRMLAARDFNDDTKDAGEIGAGHTVTALYEVVPAGVSLEPGVDPLKYQPVPAEPEPIGKASDEWMTVKLRYKLPEGDTSTKMAVVAADFGTKLRKTSRDFRHAAAVAAFAMLLRHSRYSGNADWDMIIDLAESARGKDAERQAFIDMAVTAKTLLPR